MSSPIICQKHGRVQPVATSPNLAEAISRESDGEYRIVTLEVDSRAESSRVTRYVFDREFLRKFSLSPSDDLVVLKDRSQKDKSLNDRLLINKIFSETVRVCPGCLDELIGKQRGA